MKLTRAARRNWYVQAALIDAASRVLSEVPIRYGLLRERLPMERLDKMRAALIESRAEMMRDA